MRAALRDIGSQTESHYCHLLSIGGTGMLAPAIVKLASRSRRQSIFSRGAQAFVTDAALASAVAYPLDWRSSDTYAKGIEQAVFRSGPVDLCVLWVHADAKAIVDPLIATLAQSPCRLIHVLGSATRDPRPLAEEMRRKTARHPDIAYTFVALGYAETVHGRRWLTDEEISNGVLDCERLSVDVVVGSLSELQ